MSVRRVVDLYLLLAAVYAVAQKQQLCCRHLQQRQTLMWRSVCMWGWGSLLLAPEVRPTWTPWKQKRSDGCLAAAAESGAAAQKLKPVLIPVWVERLGIDQPVPGMLAAVAPLPARLLLLQLWLILAKAGHHSQAAGQIPADVLVVPLFLRALVLALPKA